MTVDWTTFVLSGATFKQNFVNGWRRYVKPSGFPPSTVQDVYWNPRAGNWYTYSTKGYDVQDKGWPRTDLGGFLVVAESTYDFITQQYLTIQLDSQKYACWDPRRGQWMYIAARNGKTPSGPVQGNPQARRKALDAFLASAVSLQENGYIGLATLAELTAIINREQ